MKNPEQFKERFQRDNWRVRLGGLASNLARLTDFVETPAHGHLVDTLLEESEHFIEWTAPEAPSEVQATLVELQIQLALWRRNLPNLAFGQEARAWSDRVLEMSGLLSNSPA